MDWWNDNCDVEFDQPYYQGSEYIETFPVPSDLVGLAIGKKGCNIKKVERMAGIKSVKKNDCPYSNDVMFTVVGTDEEVVKEGRSMLEFHKEEFIIPDELSDEILKDDRIIDEIKGQVKVTRIYIETSYMGVKIVIIGNPENLEQAINLLDYHMDIIMEKKISLESSQEDSYQNEYPNTGTKSRRRGSGRGSQSRGRNGRRPGRRRGQGNRIGRGSRNENFNTEEMPEFNEARGQRRSQHWRRSRRLRGQGYRTERGSWDENLDTEEIPEFEEDRGQRRGQNLRRPRRSRGQGNGPGRMGYKLDTSQVSDCDVLSKDDASKKSICLALKKENCQNSSCDDLHSDHGVPYLWQAKLGDEWVTFPPEHNCKIEQQFCDLKPSTSIQNLVHRGQVYMLELSFGHHDKHSCIWHISSCRHPIEARRLSTPSFVDNPASKESFLTQWRWYWKDNSNTFLRFDTDLKHYTLEVKYLKKQEVYLYFRENFKQKYRLTFADMTQVNLDYTTVRQILRRPLFVPEYNILYRNYPQMIVSKTIELHGEDPTPDHFTPWDLAHDFELVEVDSNKTEYRKVLKDFEKTMGKSNKIICLYRVQNRKLWSEYQGKMKSMHADGEKDNPTFTSVDERDLFHGTDSLDTCRGICTNNFDFRKSGKNATLYGEGSYFARDARYSHTYAKASPSGDRFMFRAKVLVGKYTQGKSGLRRPPEIPGQGHRLYDSCVDLPHDPSIFVIFDRAQSYPEYLIHYQDNSSTGHNTRLPSSAQTRATRTGVGSSRGNSFATSTPFTQTGVNRVSHVGSSSGNPTPLYTSSSAQNRQSTSGVSTQSHVSGYSTGQRSHSATTSSGSHWNQAANQSFHYTPTSSQSTKKSGCSVM